jgi:hypothetical protein
MGKEGPASKSVVTVSLQGAPRHLEAGRVAGERGGRCLQRPPWLDEIGYWKYGERHSSGCSIFYLSSSSLTGGSDPVTLCL